MDLEKQCAAERRAVTWRGHKIKDTARKLSIYVFHVLGESSFFLHDIMPYHLAARVSGQAFL